VLFILYLPPNRSLNKNSQQSLKSFFDHHFTTKKEKSGLASKEIQATSHTKETQVAKYSLGKEFLV
jgi:hypothetical protein